MQNRKILLFVVFNFVLFQQKSFSRNQQIKILFKMQTNLQKERFFEHLTKYCQLLSNKYQYKFLISGDPNLSETNNHRAINRLQKQASFNFKSSQNKSIAEAYNQGIAQESFDILIIANDNLVPTQRNYDDRIVNMILKNFPDLDGILYFNNGTPKDELNKCLIIGKQYYERFKYIYHPHYKTSICVKEFTNVAQLLKKVSISNEMLFKSTKNLLLNTINKPDESKKNCEEEEDKLLYNTRSEVNYNIDLKTSSIIKWSILIPTLNNRKHLFNKLYNKLTTQIKKANLQNFIELLSEPDDGELSVGSKRNSLLKQSKGEYISFVDDDDDVSQDFIKTIYEKLKIYPDCISLQGIVTTNNKNPHLFIHSIKYDKFFTENNIYYRPPNHLNPIRRDIAIRFKFPSKYVSEDYDWAMQICNSHLLKKEEEVTKPYYFYIYSSQHSVQVNKRKN
ncbi:TPA: hypothetical protein DIC20_03900 [Candidatus Dependentiae bacterium]|nr:MAG: hypothetical protein US03_C0001G0167 [candidate division TM6 bacterium GW2011_GWF2_36_131]KKQ03697.1 MAG: hypothetical protein US13_C0001G0037 [candidate division TM6 bacterium GW2011_GWE2_36_25]KKQ20067.1 MAG: hypothetical protein US32_C0002G0072 [candidate division TM6 bacterium GW2011_GWA2_36_9]HBR70464.1 hypothetical protein [Candidatus Dependentiae bacterium]HCU00820.1 hypothetical protein [Candidatus Dependentiae bacterium]